MNNVYQSLPTQEKIKIFQRCQEILVKNHPTSEFIIRRSLLQSKNNKFIETLVKLYKDFNGNVYSDKDCLVFYKIFDINDLNDVYKKYDKPSEEEGNSIFIIFATFNKQVTNIQELISRELENKIQKISFSREGKFKVYDLKKFSSKFL